MMPAFPRSPRLLSLLSSHHHRPYPHSIFLRRTLASSSSSSSKRPQNLVEKIVQRHIIHTHTHTSSSSSSPSQVHSGDFVSIQPAHVLTHDNTWAVMAKFATLLPDDTHTHTHTHTHIANPRQPVLALDHNVQDRSEKNLVRYAAIEAFARVHSLDFYPAGRGIGHQIMCEEGYVQPGWMVVASDSHSNMYGALGALGTPIVRTDAAGIWVTGSTWWQVPPVVKVVLKGKLNKDKGVGGKDVILALCGAFGKDEVLNHAVEFVFQGGGGGDGGGGCGLSMEDRLTISNMTTEWGALAGVFPVDEVTVAWLEERSRRLKERYSSSKDNKTADATHTHTHTHTPPQRVLTSATIAQSLRHHGPTSPYWERPDAGASYAKELELDLSRLVPLAAGPNAIKTVTPVSVLERQQLPIQKAYIVSCVNSRVGDLAAAADVFRNHDNDKIDANNMNKHTHTNTHTQTTNNQKLVAPHVHLYIAAASSEVEAESRARGDWQVLLAAGAIPLPSGCGPCVGLGRGLLKEGERAISATNRNFKGRMGARSAEAYLASPRVVALSAWRGYICGGGGEEGEVVGVEGWKGMGRVRVSGGVGGKEEEKVERKVVIIDGFPARVEGKALLVPQANIDTDGIYAGRHCYEDLDARAQAQVAMENYDPAFASLVRQGDVLVTGANFGCGSSREQAATALRACGISVIVAKSANETFRRNALNNGVVVLEVPGLVEELMMMLSLGEGQGDVNGGKATATAAATIRVAGVGGGSCRVEVDFTRSVASLVFVGGKGEGKESERRTKEFAFAPVGTVAQEIVVAGGLEGWVREKRGGGRGGSGGGGGGSVGESGGMRTGGVPVMGDVKMPSVGAPRS